jgi:zinc protease
MKKLLIALLFTTTAFAQNVTPQQVLDKYFDAIGGKANMEKVKDFYAVSTTEVMGQSMEAIESKKAPNKYSSVVDQNGTELAKVIFDGTKASITQMGNTQMLEGENTRAILTQALIFPETLYLTDDINLSSQANEKVNEEDCYVISVSGVAGIESLKEYYSVASGLKLKQSIEAANGAAIIYFKDYKDYNGVKFATHVVQEAMGMAIDKKFTVVKINGGIPDSEFEIK